MAKILRKKMIEPSTPTPHNLKNYSISLTDQLSPPTNIPIILFYPPPPPPSSGTAVSDHLQQSLARILPQFYPLAGNYLRNCLLVHCSDEGVEFVEATACPGAGGTFENISDYVRSGAHERLNGNLLPRLSCEADEATDPIASIQATRFGCGGLAIALSVSHRVVDTHSILAFVRAWAKEAATNFRNPCLKKGEKIVVNPNFDSPKLLPFKNLFPGSEEEVPLRRTLNPEITARRFFFSKDTIETLKAKKARDNSRRATKVGAICALISMAMIRVDRLKHGRFRNHFIGQSVDIRHRTVPPFSKDFCGNLLASATLKLCGSKVEKVGFKYLLSLLRKAVDETVEGCRSLFNDEELGHKVLCNPLIDLMREIKGGEEGTNVVFFSDWSKFDFYGVDFGWGKPIRASTAAISSKNFVVLLGSEGGDGIEAWVHMLKEDMVLFEQDEDINGLHCTCTWNER